MTGLTDYQRGYIDGFDAPINVAARAVASEPVATSCLCGHPKSYWTHGEPSRVCVNGACHHHEFGTATSNRAPYR